MFHKTQEILFVVSIQQFASARILEVGFYQDNVFRHDGI